MPITFDDQPVIFLRTPTAAPEPDPFRAGPSGADVLGAAFRQENTISNVVSLLNRPIYAPEPGYNPIEAIRGTKYERDHLDGALDIRSAAEMRDWQSRIDREEADKRALHDAGGWGVAAGILAGTIDPLMFLPIGGAVKSVKGGYSAVRSAGMVGGLTALQTGVSELALQSAQETRTAAESAIAIATSGVLGGLIGGGAAALLTRAERQALESAFEQDRRFVTEIVEGSAGQPVSAGAAATDVRQLKLVGYGLDKVPGLDTLIEKMSPTLRVFSSDNVSAKRAMADLAETALRFEDNERGISTSFGGAPVSRVVQAQKLGMQLDAAETLKDAFTAYRFGDAVPSGAMVRAAFDDLRGAVEDGKLSFNDFKREVTNALFSGDVHAVPQVEQAAKGIRANILEPIRQKAIDLGLLDPDAAPKGDPSWFARVWNREKLAERRPDAVKRFADWMEGEQTRKAAAQERLSAVSDELDAVDATRAKLEAQVQRLEESTHKLEGQISERAMEARRAAGRVDVLADRRALIAQEQSEIEEFITTMRQEVRDPALRERIGILEDRRSRAATRRELLDEAIRLQDAAEAEIMTRIEQELGEWGGRSANEALSAIKARDKAVAGRMPNAPRLAGADKPIMKAVARILDSDRNLSRAELDARANEIVDRILGTPDGRLPYDAASGGPKNLATPETGEMRGALRSRDFAIPTSLVRDLIEDDAEHVLSTVTRTLLPDMALVERFGDVDMTEAMKKIVDESAAKAARTTNAKELKAIEAEKQRLLRDVAATRDRIRGTYGFSQDATGRDIARYAQIAKNFNVITDLGTAALNSMGDAAGVVFRHGFVNTFRDGWAPFFQRMLTTSPAGEADKRQLRAMLLAVETQTNLRGHSIADVAENYRPGTRFERAMRWAADKSQIVNGQTFWTDWTKGIAATVGSAEMLRATERVALGKATAKDIANLAESSIDQAMAMRIHKAFADGGGAKVDGARLPNTAEWKDRGAARAFEAALQREVDMTVITPGLEKPLWMSKPVASLLGQFKAFIAASNERMLIANLQRSDWNTLQGLFAAVTLGMLSYRLYMPIPTKPPLVSEMMALPDSEMMSPPEAGRAGC